MLKDQVEPISKTQCDIDFSSYFNFKLSNQKAQLVPSEYSINHNRMIYFIPWEGTLFLQYSITCTCSFDKPGSSRFAVPG